MAAFARLVILLAAACVCDLTRALATDPCNGIPIDPNAPPRDGHMFVRDGRDWTDFRSLAALTRVRAGSTVEFAYVVRPLYGGDRTGVLVIKTNRPAKDTDRTTSRDKIWLDRRGVEKDRRCKPDLANFPNGQQLVSTRAYEDYHDYGAQDTGALRRYTEENDTAPIKRDRDGQKIEAFHFTYLSERKQQGCIRTDNHDFDEFPWNGNSNRAQFSFDKTVVENGSYSGFRLFTAPNDATTFRGMAEHRTQMKRYETVNGMACVRFSLKVDSLDYTFRVNDLEGRPTATSKRRTAEETRP